MSKILDSAKEAVAFAKGEQPAARITIKGHTYVPLAEVTRLRAALQQIADLSKTLHPSVSTLGTSMRIAAEALK